ncbi:MAG TPA: hypothetical protein VG406_02260 [Isosphaeraceae bacterium]|jgi:transposase|nr:hypothetical protein [Isosphaeraceae bacterium]
MPAIYIDCPTCGWENKIGEELAGQKVTCPKCKASFAAEVGGSYDLADSPGPPPAAAEDDPWSPPSTPGRLRPPPPREQSEPTQVDPELEDLLERWAEE